MKCSPTSEAVNVRVLGVDYGLKRTGIAIGDTETRMALPFDMFENLSDPELARAIAKLAKEERVAALIIGLPLHADGAVSQQSKLTQKFITLLETELTPAIPLHRMSEHLTTHTSEGKLAGHFTRQQKRQRVDALAAAAILQDWLDRQDTQQI